jgi:acyl-CoA thioesterase-1
MAAPANRRTLQIAGNDAMKGMSLTDAAANRAEIRTRLHARGIRTIEAR